MLFQQVPFTWVSRLASWDGKLVQLCWSGGTCGSQQKRILGERRLKLNLWEMGGGAVGIKERKRPRTKARSSNLSALRSPRI